MYISLVSNVITANNLQYRQHAKDTQLYMAVRTSAIMPFTSVSDCVQDISCWFLENKLLLNPIETEAVMFGTRVQWEKFTTSGRVNVAESPVLFRQSIKLLGVTVNAAFTMDHHVMKSSTVASSTHVHSTHLITDTRVAKMVAHSIVTIRLD